MDGQANLAQAKHRKVLSTSRISMLDCRRPRRGHVRVPTGLIREEEERRWADLSEQSIEIVGCGGPLPTISNARARPNSAAGGRALSPSPKRRQFNCSFYR